MSNNIIDSHEIRDTDTHTFEITGPSATETVTFQYANGHDQSVDVVLSGTYDGDDFSDSVELDTTSVSSDGTAKVALSEPWDVVRCSVSAGTAPTSGSLTMKKHG